MQPLTVDQYEHIVRTMCPCCLWGIPSIRDSDREMFIHVISKKLKVDCLANEFRGNSKIPVEKKE